MPKDPKTTLVGLVLIAVGVYLIIQKGVTPDSLAILSTGAGFCVAADAKKTPPQQ
jgi:drug/metabolite transporter (DMT)-like permease